MTEIISKENIQEFIKRFEEEFVDKEQPLMPELEKWFQETWKDISL
jgi:hypothetical protein